MKQTPNLEQLKQNPDAAALLNDQQALRQLLQSQDARRTLSLLQQQSGPQLQEAAKQAGQGNTAALSAILERFADSTEGKGLMEQLERQLHK
ncbi:MAG: hypothetical protein LUD79_06410 [Oscillospiraceae bacterium]|nr:hypothetical protein [Oscillospiraceae bacterium]